jgi:hypothetical protein
MSNFERQNLEIQLKSFTSRNFERPADCRNIDQIRFYVRELCLKIEEYENRFSYVPPFAYNLLAQYNLVQNRIIQVDFHKTYSHQI